MARFLHIADVHLGIRRYDISERTRDFFRAWREVIERHAIGRRVDFVLIAGDLFDQRKIDPQTANHAVVMLRRLRDARIPVIAIEGNHDQRDIGSNSSWLRSFSQWRFLNLLEPEWEDGRVVFRAWDEERARGSYIDIADVRIFGSTWYGTTIKEAVPRLIEAILPCRRQGAANILLLHTDVEGQLLRHSPAGALPLTTLAQLRHAVEYLALGHTHKRFEIDGWAFNPGSLEACSVDEAGLQRGAYLVETDGPKIVKTEFIQAGKEFFQRPFRRRSVELKGDEEPDQVRSAILEMVREECEPFKFSDEDQKPLVEVTLRGKIGFRASQLRLDKLKEEAIEAYRPMGLIINNKTAPKEMPVPIDMGKSRQERELEVLEGLIRANSIYGPRAEDIARLVVKVKQLALEGGSAEEALRLMEDCLFPK